MIDDVRPRRRPSKSLPADDTEKPDVPEAAEQTAVSAEPETTTDEPVETEVFRTPEEVASEDQQHAEADPAADTEPAKPHRKLWHWPPTLQEYIILATVVVLAGGGVAWYLLHRPAKPVPVAKVAHVVKPKPTPKITTVASALSGLQVDPSVNQRPVIGVMIENSLDARPQSGLSQASIVFEAIAEGGITRFLALFQDTQPDNIGPIRSARPYYVQWALGFNAGYAHVGGSPEALSDIKNWGVRDLDQFYNGGSYHRISSRAAPHNVYTAVGTLTNLAISKGYTTSSFTSFVRKTELPSKTPTAKSINLTLSGPAFNVHYDYVAASNSYNRSEGGAPHVDANTNAQISPKVVVALVIPYSLESDGYHSDYNTLGSGPMFVFQDGLVTQGTWSKTDNTSQFVFTGADGKPLALNPGQTWITAVSGSGNVSYTP